MFSGNDEQLVNCLRALAQSSFASKGERAIAGAAADRIEAMRAALALWLAYNDDYDGGEDDVPAMIAYANALDATRAVLKKD